MPTTILGIESSCDETAVAIVRDGHQVLASQVASQIDLHKVFGGVVPEVASREHLRRIDPLVAAAFDESGLSLADIDVIAVTQGPGLIGALLVGVSYAKGLALAHNVPLVPVDHVHAHVHGALLGCEISAAELYPALALVVSGGHTNLYELRSPTEFHLLGQTIDDACGECFDKVAKLLGLPYPGGPHVERLASTGDPARWPMPRMVEEKARLVFSYSGLKTHMATVVRREQPQGQAVSDLCAAFQDEALGQIVRKLQVALAQRSGIQRVLVAGGVAANRRFQELTAALPVPVLFPPLKFCADNAAMIAALGFYLWEKGPRDALTRTDWDAYSRYDFARHAAP